MAMCEKMENPVMAMMSSNDAEITTVAGMPAPRQAGGDENLMTDYGAINTNQRREGLLALVCSTLLFLQAEHGWHDEARTDRF